MINSYIEDGIKSDSYSIANPSQASQLGSVLEEHEVYPLIQELNHAYGFKVCDEVRIRKSMWNNKANYSFSNIEETDETVSGYLLTLNSLPRAYVFYDKNGYNMVCDYQIKDRGADTWERHTISSKKISQIIKTLVKKKYVATIDDIGQGRINLSHLKSAYIVDGKSIRTWESDLSNHAYELQRHGNTHYIESLIRLHYGDKAPVSHEANQFFTDYVDKYNKLLHYKQSAEEEVMSEFQRGYTCIGISMHQKHSPYYIGELDMVYSNDRDSHDGKAFVLKNTRCVSLIEDLPFHDKIISLLTMLKLRNEDLTQTNTILRDYWRKSHDYWDEDLGIAFYNYDSNTISASPFDIYWLLLPIREEKVAT